ncbi:hypothetical protein KVH31_34465 [Streptomyces olivaceus]|uniref:hypothetical protein n=1 Tax=Streptomyces olivaceus TaxID=47716 RepID=UPI001CCC0F87|nr:hypothetical protein [Streptomyces olivaceus]MBZ6211601.1 hypothetical protein [Streptomyces olivaceus]
MGNMHGTVYRNGRQIDVGYGVPTTCEQPGCTEQIDRGLAYLCGSVHGGDEYSCGGYFCGQHLYTAPEGHHGNRCVLCVDRGADPTEYSPDAMVATFN